MEDVRDLKESQLDAMREVANIGAGHAATALSQMTNRRIMITVPRVKIKPLEDARDMLLFPQPAALVLCDFLFRRERGTTTTFGEMEQSGLKEAGNILASTYLN